jgi:hypothetical protein
MLFCSVTVPRAVPGKNRDFFTADLGTRKLQKTARAVQAARSNFGRIFSQENLMCNSIPQHPHTFHFTELIQFHGLGCRGEPRPRVNLKSSFLFLERFCFLGRNVRPSVRCFVAISGMLLLKRMLGLCSPFALISSKRDLNTIAIGCFLQHYSIVDAKSKWNPSLDGKRKDNQVRTIFRRTATIAIMF